MGDEEGGNPKIKYGFITLIALVILGLVFIIVYAWPTTQAASTQAASIGAFAAMAAAAAFMAGALVGFLFGIPRSLQIDHSASLATEKDRRLYGANTNLEQISDWLTKILVGVGLTQLARLPSLIRALGESLSPGLGGGNGSYAFGVVLTLYFAATGFLGGYLSTRIVLPELFRWADLPSLIKKRVQEEVRTQDEADAKALGIVDQYLSGAAARGAVSEDLVEAMEKASQRTRVQIFDKAYRALVDGKKNKDKDLISRTVPIFEALISIDTADRYHRNHGLLALALQEIDKPDWARSEREVTKAIEIRARLRKSGWLAYEVRRARARIRLSSEPNSIKSDLRTAAADERGRREIRKEKDVTDWLAKNNVKVEELSEA